MFCTSSSGCADRLVLRLSPRRSPWQLIARIVALAALEYAVRWKRNIYLGMVVHCTLNTLGVLIISALILGRL